MNQHPELLYRLMSGTPYLKHGPKKYTPAPVGTFFKKVLSTATVVLTNEEICVSNEVLRLGDWEQMTRICGPQKLPFDILWIEMGGPFREEMLTGDPYLPDIYRVGYLVMPMGMMEKLAGQKPWHPHLCGYTLQAFHMASNGNIARNQCNIHVEVDERGDITDMAPAAFEESGINERDRIDKEDFAHLIEDALPVLYTLGLMNCKNVSLEPHSYKSRSSNRKLRSVSPRINFNTIKLPAPRKLSSPSGTGDTGTSALHKVRGHFKTYTDEAPLLGKHTGTYWWGWQVRGNADNGAVISDYKIGK